MSRILVLFLFLNSFNAFGQCPSWSNLNDCGTLNALGGVCNSATIFCIGDSVGVQNLSTGSVDSSFICWDDGTVQGFAGNFTGCIKHKYNYPLDSCVGGNGQIQKLIRIGIKKSCAPSESFHFIITPIDIKFKPKAQFTVAPNVACLGIPVSIINSSCLNSTNPTHYWDFGDGSNSTNQNPNSHTYNSPGTYTISYTITNSCGSSTESKTITVLPPTIVNPISQLNDYCSPVNFTPDVNSQNALTFLWTSSVGSGITITNPVDSQPYFQISSAGNYTINLLVTGCCSSPGSDCQWDTTMTILQGPSVSSNPLPIFCGNAVITPSNYISATGSISQYIWSFPGGTPSSSNSQNSGNVTYNSSGNFPISLVVVSSCGNDTLIDTLKVLPPTVIQPMLNYSGNCTPLQIVGNMNAANGLSYNWTINPSGSGVISNPNSTNTSITINTPGTTTISASATGCCTSPQSNCTWDTTINTIQGPNISSNPIPTFCGTAFINPSNYITVSGIISQYNWSFPGGTPASSSNSTPGNVNYNSPGSYPISLTVTNSCGNATITDTVRILPPTVINPQLNYSGLCTPLQIVGNMNSSNSNSLTWSLNPSGNGTIATPNNTQTNISITSPGTITINANATGCCTAAQSNCSWDTTFTILQGPVLNASSIPDFCNSATINVSQYFTTGGAISSYQWDFSGGSPVNSTNAIPGMVTYSVPGIYQISLIASGSCGADTIINSLLVGSPPIINVSPSNIFGCDTLTVSYINNSPPNQSYNWQASNGTFIGGTNNTSASPFLYFSSPGFYSVNLTASSPGCNPISNSFNVTIGEAPKLTQTGNIDDICDTILLNLNSYFNLIPSTSDSGYSWNITHNGNSIFNYTGNNPNSVMINDTGTYIVQVLAWNACDSIILIDTFFYTLPPTLTLPTDSVICRGSGIIPLFATPLNGLWSWNGSLILTGFFKSNLTNNVFNELIYSYGVATCAVSDSFSVSVIGADINAGNDTAFCSNSSALNFTATPPGGLWSGAGVVDPVTGFYNPSLPILSVDTLIYTLTDTTYNCVVRDTIFVTIFHPTVGSSVIPDTACINQPVFFSNNAPGTSSIWDLGDGSGLFFNNTVTHLYTNSGSFTVTLIYENQFGCKDTAYGPIEIVQPPDALFSMDTNRGCAILPITLNNLSTFYGSNYYFWNYGNGTTNTVFNPGTIFLNQGPGDSTKYEITLTVSNGCGVATHVDSVTVYPIPVPDFGIVYNDSCSPALITFNNITTGQPQSFEWYINGLLVSIDSILLPQVFIADSTDSTYTITLIASNRCGTDSLSKSITIRPNSVKAFFNSDKTFGCRPLTITFTSVVAANSIIDWNFGDGNTASGGTVTYTFDTTGFFTVWQFVDNFCGFDSISQLIEVLPQPQLSFDLIPKACDNEPILISNTSPNLSGYYWDFGDLSTTDSINYSPWHLFELPGQYNVTLIGFAMNTGCADTLSKIITVVGHPFANFTMSTTNGCAPLTVNLISNSLNSIYNIWSFGNSDTLVGNSINYTYSQPGQYSLILTVIDTNLCKDDSVYNFINVFPVPEAEFTWIQNPLCLLPTTLNFINNSIDAISYQWDIGNYGQHVAEHPVINLSTAGTFNCTLIAQNAYLCRDTLQKQIKVYGETEAIFTPMYTSGCIPFTVTFLNNSLNANNAIWSFGTGDSSHVFSPTYTYTSIGVYTVELIVRNDSVCYDTISITNAVTTLSIPTADFTYTEILDTLVNPSGIFAFFDNSINAISWIWNFGDGKQVETIANPIHRFENNGIFYVTLIVFNDQNCPDTIIKAILIDYLSSLFIPNAFSPDAGTEETQYFIPKGAGISQYQIEVFSPYGEKVWASDELTNGHPSEKWDGTFNNIELPQGAYVWKANAIFQSGKIWNGMSYRGEKPTRVGSVMILR